jgi:Cu/Ag efflux pump CusA
MDRFEAADAAARQRFRPIILTSLTTFGGLAPMIFETSVQARILIPMAVSLGYGVMFATLITLLLVPSLFVLVERPRDYFKRRRAARLGEDEAEETPAQLEGASAAGGEV